MRFGICEDGDHGVRLLVTTVACLCVWAGDTEVEELNPAVPHLRQCGVRNPELLGHRLPTTITRATVEDSMAGLVGYPSTTSPGMCINPMAYRLPGGTQAQRECDTTADAGLSLALGVGQPMCRAHNANAP